MRPLTLLQIRTGDQFLQRKEENPFGEARQTWTFGIESKALVSG